MSVKEIETYELLKQRLSTDSTWTKNREQFEKMLFESDRQGAKELLIWLKSKGYEYESSSTKYHDSQPGGWLTHTMNVFNQFIRILGATPLRDKVPYQSAVIACLCHDLCKIGRYNPQAYKSNYNGHKIGEFNGYEFIPPEVPMGHGIESLLIAQRFMNLTDQEQVLIRWHMGMYDKDYFDHAEQLKKKYPELLIMQLADNLAATLSEGEN